MTTENEQLIQFCPSCFADEDSGSWNHVVIGGHCMNCGAAGAVSIPRYAVAEIRRSAAWVGARYYPDDDTKDQYAELRALRKAIGKWPGRTATLVTEERPDGGIISRWRLRQNCLGVRHGMWIETTVPVLGGETAEEAIARTGDALPWAGG